MGSYLVCLMMVAGVAFTAAWVKFEVHQNMQLTDDKGEPMFIETHREQQTTLCESVMGMVGREKLRNMKLMVINGIFKNENKREIIELDCTSSTVLGLRFERVEFVIAGKPLKVKVYKLKNDHEKEGDAIGTVTLGQMTLDFQIWEAIKNHEKGGSKPWKDVTKIIHYDIAMSQAAAIKEDYTFRYNHDSSRYNSEVELRIKF